MLRIALSHDIDRTKKTYQFLTKSIKSLLKFKPKGFFNQLKSLTEVTEAGQYWTFKDFIEIEESYGLKSTVFFLNESIKLNYFKLSTYKLALGRYKIDDLSIIEIIKWLDVNGWEIGLHGSYNSFKDINLLHTEKIALERIVGHKIIGIRQHYLNMNNNTWSIQNELGFKYDSSLGFTDRIGFKNDIHLPFHPFKDDFLVIPLVLMDTCFMATKNRWFEFERIVDLCESTGGILVINFHQHVFNKYDFPGFKEAYIEIIERLKAKNAEFLTLSQVWEQQNKK
jgi:peptidoglycan/xylan/chitin deacetylase (PgdA/CDA1 family)